MMMEYIEMNNMIEGLLPLKVGVGYDEHIDVMLEYNFLLEGEYPFKYA